jgi:general secretion pathway protein L
MTEIVVLKLGYSPSDPVAWGAISGGRLQEAGRAGSLKELAGSTDRLSVAAKIVAVLPGEQVALREIPSPPKQTAKLRAAAAYLLEDELAENIEDLHVVVTTGTDGARAFAVSKSLIDAWNEAFADAGVEITNLSVDYSLLGAGKSVCVIAEDRGRIIAAHGGVGFAAELALADIIAPSFLQASGDATIISYGAHDHVSRWAAVPVERRPLVHEADLIALFGENLSAKGEFPEFLSGDFRRNRKRLVQFKIWRRPAALAASLTLALVALGGASGLRDWRIAERYESTAERLHKSAFPTYEGGDIRSHVRGLLASGAKTIGFLETTARLTSGLEAHPDISIERIRFDAARGQYVFSIRSTSDAGIEAFRTGLLSLGIEATDNGGYRRNGDLWVGEMTARAR